MEAKLKSWLNYLVSYRGEVARVGVVEKVGLGCSSFWRAHGQMNPGCACYISYRFHLTHAAPEHAYRSTEVGC